MVHAGLPALAWWLPNNIRAPMPRAVQLIGKGVALAGGALTVTSVVTLVRHGEGTPAPHDPPQLFVCHGPYRFCRNPMELGNLLALLGRAIALGSPRLTLAAALFAAATQVWVVLIEEPYLVRHFGQRYEQYRQHVPRWGWRSGKPKPYD
jgi:protein-S-isoprenylcysteine O-methyltransferase Ste14